MNSTELIIDKNFCKIHDSYRKSVKKIAIDHINQILIETNEWINFNKVMFHIFWDGSHEDIHSFITFGEYLQTDQTQENEDIGCLSLEDYDIRNSPYYDELDGYVEDFFGDDAVTINPNILHSINHFIQVILIDCCLFDVAITAQKDTNGVFKIDIQNTNDWSK